jgi:hypothetical protein
LKAWLASSSSVFRSRRVDEPVDFTNILDKSFFIERRKVRFTWASATRYDPAVKWSTGRLCARLAVALAVAFAACAHEAPRPASRANAASVPESAAEASGGQGEIILADAARADGPKVLGAWMVYGFAKAGLSAKHPPPPANDSVDDYEIELGARRDLSEYWSEAQKGADPAPYPRLDREVEIWRAGFLPELVVAIHSKPGWTVPPAAIQALRLEEFGRKFPGGYAPGAPVAVRAPSGKVVPDVPGADFPDLAALPYGPESCDRLRPERRAAWTRWAALEPRLGGGPVAAGTTLDFARALTAMKRDPARAARGATWVSTRVGHLAALEGFCANEQKDWRLAVVFLEKAAALLPDNPHVRLELSMANMMLGKRPEALAIADDVRGWTHDACAVAVAWRRRGFILIDLGDLEGARAAYERSLKIDPGSDIARRELAAIAEAIASDRVSDKPLPPPPPDAVHLTECRH